MNPAVTDENIYRQVPIHLKESLAIPTKYSINVGTELQTEGVIDRLWVPLICTIADKEKRPKNKASRHFGPKHRRLRPVALQKVD